MRQPRDEVSRNSDEICGRRKYSFLLMRKMWSYLFSQQLINICFFEPKGTGFISK
jgi:hypothetical protein